MCNARKREQSRKTTINFLFDGRLGLVFFVGMKTIRTMSWEVNLIDLIRAWIVQWHGFRFCHRISFNASDTNGADKTRSLAFSCCLVCMNLDLAPWGFLSALKQNFLGVLVCNARKRKHSRKTPINFPSDGRLGPVFFVGTKTTRPMPWDANLVHFTFL